MKLISLWEPWATLMALGAKKIETRSWRTQYTGWLAIHASKGGLSKQHFHEVIAENEFYPALKGFGPFEQWAEQTVRFKKDDARKLFPLGHIIAVVNLVECLPMEPLVCLPGVFDDYPELDTPRERAFGDYSEGRWGWVTDQLFRLPEPIPYRGHQGIRDLPDEVGDEITRQWVEARRERP